MKKKTSLHRNKEVIIKKRCFIHRREVLTVNQNRRCGKVTGKRYLSTKINKIGVSGFILK